MIWYYKLMHKISVRRFKKVSKGVRLVDTNNKILNAIKRLEYYGNKLIELKS